MPTKPPTHRPHGTRPPARGPRPSAHARGYGRDWQALRLAHLAEHPLCGKCKDKGLVVEATEVDHVTPHGGDRVLLFDKKNLQSLCKPCHSRKTVTTDGGLGRAITPTTCPIDVHVGGTPGAEGETPEGASSTLSEPNHDQSRERS